MNPSNPTETKSPPPSLPIAGHGARRLLEELSRRLDKNKPPRPPKRLFWLLFLLILSVGLFLFDYLSDRETFTPQEPTLSASPFKEIYGGHYESPPPVPDPYKDGVPEDLRDRAAQTFRYTATNTHPTTYIAYSFTGDQRLSQWGLTYDNSMRAIALMQTGQIEQAKRVVDYFIETPGIKETGYILKDGRRTPISGWLINIIDASSARYGGRGVEYIIHVGPNTYAALASAHLYSLTQEPKYLNFSIRQWERMETLQNKTVGDPNYGGIRMGPMSAIDNPFIQRVGFKKENPSFYELYNGEHSADFKALSDMLAELDPNRAERYLAAASLIETWDKTIYDPTKHLFYIGTTEKRFYDDNIGQWVDPGVIPMYPLDTQALKLSAYGVDGMESFEPNGAEKVRASIEKYFRVEVEERRPSGETVNIAGYDFIGTEDREKIIYYEEGGPDGDTKFIRGVGRKPILSDEWSSWVAFADLRLAEDYEEKGNMRRAQFYFFKWFDNAVVQGRKSAIPIGPDQLTYPYARPLPYALNKPVGFGWNTHHHPYALIGGVTRVLGFLRFDPLRLHGGKYAQSIDIPSSPPTGSTERNLNQKLLVEPEMFVEKAWTHFNAGKKSPDQVKHWALAIDTVDKMLKKHPEWINIAQNQNTLAARSRNPFPYSSFQDLSEKEAFSVYRRYWSLYHIGAAMYIKAISHANLSRIYQDLRGDEPKAARHSAWAWESSYALRKQYTFAQIFDPGGWFWQPKDVVERDIQMALSR